MNETYYLPQNIQPGARAMVFVDGEYLALRYKELLGEGAPEDHVVYEPGVFVWSPFANVPHHKACDVVRRHYYTSVVGDEQRLQQVVVGLKAVGIEQPRVFKKSKARPSKRVDVSLCTEMLSHAHRKNFEIGILVSGDEDFVPLVEAVAAEGRRVVLWALPSGLSKSLENAADHSFDLSRFLFRSAQWLNRR